MPPEDGQLLEEAEIIGVCNALLIAGNVTTTDLIGNAVLALLQHPGELSKLLAEPNLVRSTVEEVLRLRPRASYAGTRIATQAMRIGRCPVAAGQTIAAYSMQPIMTRRRILIQSGSTSNGQINATTHLAGALISVLARHWPGPRHRSLFRCFSSNSRSCGSEPTAPWSAGRC